jgi:hypothetical protein
MTDEPEKLAMTGAGAQAVTNALNVYRMWKAKEAEALKLEVAYRELADLAEAAMGRNGIAVVNGEPVAKLASWTEERLSQGYLREKYPAIYLDCKHKREVTRFSIILPAPSEEVAS